jgi:phosphate transport system permease protein
MSDDSGNKTTIAIQASLKKRYARERRFQWYGRIAVLSAVVFLSILLADIVIKGTPAFTQHYIKVAIDFDPAELGISSTATADEIASADFSAVVKASLRQMFPEVSSRTEKTDQ